MNTLVRLHNCLNPADTTLYAPRTSADELFSSFFRPTSAGAPEIRLDVTEDDKAYRVSAALAGVKKEDIQLAVDKNEVTIEVEIKRESNSVENEKTLHRERFYGKTSRAFAVAEDIDEANVEARYVDGVLQLTLPKKAQVSAKRITIS
ncbi:MAG: Hsp20/alpha crystallin family protein [Pseudomonadota bacterium]